MITASTYGAPNWADLATTDIDAAIDFYRELLGWEVEKTQVLMADYYVGKVGERQVAGMTTMPEHEATFPMWTTFVYVEDVDVFAEHVLAAGGALLQEPFDLLQGRVAIVADPGGAMFGILSGLASEGTWMSQEPGSVCWVELLTRDVPTAEAFYLQVFDWKAETQMHGTTPYTTFALEGEPVAGMMPMPEEVPPEAPANWSVYFSVEDCGGSAARAARLGGSILLPVRAIAPGHFAVLQDPQGAVFQLMDYRA